MSDDPKGSGNESGNAVVSTRTLSPIVVRSTDVPPGLHYGEYRKYLRYDFYYSCAYCSMTESEAHGIRFTIDHYEPVSAKDELKGLEFDAYGNLMYACDECNSRKGDLYPPPNARAAGLRFFRIDIEPRSQHFRLEGNTLVGLTDVGNFTIDYVDLNREGLQRLREIRRKLYEYEGYASEGISALAKFAIDRLPQEVRQRALSAINKAIGTAHEAFDSLDEALIAFAESELLIDEVSEEGKQRNKERLARIRQQQGIYPGTWRGRKHTKKKH